MKEEDRTYKEWLDAIRSKQPVLTNPEELTADILQKVSVLKKAKEPNKPGRPEAPKRLSKRLYIFGSWLSGLSAAVLICFLLTESMRMSGKPEHAMPGFVRESVPASILPSNWKLMTLPEKRDYLSAYQQQQARKKQLVYKNIEKKLLKATCDENK